MMSLIVTVNITGEVEAQCPSVTVAHFTMDLWVSTSVSSLPVGSPSLLLEEKLLKSWPFVQRSSFLPGDGTRAGFVDQIADVKGISGAGIKLLNRSLGSQWSRYQGTMCSCGFLLKGPRNMFC